MARRGYTISDRVADSLQGALNNDELLDSKGNPDQLQSLSYRLVTKGRRGSVDISFADGLDATAKRRLLEQEIRHLRRSKFADDAAFLEEMGRTIKALSDNEGRKVDLSVGTVIIPERKSTEGVLIRSTSAVWEEIVKRLEQDWDEAFSIPDRIWEEIIAGAFVKEGYSEVVLTPRSGDYGRDVIARSKGVGCIKVIGSVKAYDRGKAVRQDDVRALLGVLQAEQDASKAIMTTTSRFAPRLKSDPFIKPYLPYRLELIDGGELQAWLVTLRRGR